MLCLQKKLGNCRKSYLVSGSVDKPGLSVWSKY